MKRSRTFTGCGTCRSRHVKCDEARPECGMCTSLGIRCTGYQSRLQWRDEDPSTAQTYEDGDDGRFRHRLFSEAQQSDMAASTVTSLGRMTLTKALGDLETEESSCRDLSKSGQLDHRFHGPFGVLFPTPEASPKSSSSPPGSHIVTPYNTAPSQQPSQQPSPPVHIPQVLSSSVPETAPELLRYFKNHGVTFSYSMKPDKAICPWENIHFPVAERTYAQLLLHGTSTPTDMSLFYSILAASCLHRARHEKAPQSTYWAELGAQYKQTSRQHLEQAIQDELVPIIPTKYKKLLMALLSMTMLEIHCTKYDEAEYLLLESEYLIRTRGLIKPRKSLQVRSLHHVYTYLRILTESTCGCIMRNICPARPTARSRLATPDSAQRLRSFRVADQSTESDLRMYAIKDDAVAEDDVHLEAMGQYEGSLFPRLHGLPEALLGLLSQTIRLANEQELMHRDTQIDASMITNIVRRTKALEHNVLSWTPSPVDVYADGAGSNLEEAFHQAIILFYYRRVQNINALMLQDVVRKVLAPLVQVTGTQEAAALLWPAFLAACEAIKTPLRDSLAAWLQRMEQETCLPAFGVVADAAKKVWALRDERQDYTLSWFDTTNSEGFPHVVL